MNEKRLKEIIKEEYFNRLLAAKAAAEIAEAKLYDQRGNLLISPDLKVRHEESGYEYTVDSIEGEGEHAMIRLRKPEIPRIEPPRVAKRMNELDGEGVEIEDLSQPITQVRMEGETIFTVSAEEFEKEYVVD